MASLLDDPPTIAPPEGEAGPTWADAWDAMMASGRPGQQSAALQAMLERIQGNPVGTETTAPTRFLDQAQPDFQPGVQMGALGMASRRFADTTHAIMDAAKGWMLGTNLRGGPFDAVAPVERSLPAANYRTPLSDYAPTLYRQAAPSEVLDYIPGMRMADKTVDTPFFADHPSIALGQGGNKDGVLLAFDSNGIHGQINASKPSFEPSWRSGYGEYRGTHNDQAAYQNALIGVRIPDNLTMTRLEARHMQNVAGRLKAAGWESRDGPGYTEYRRPRE